MSVINFPGVNIVRDDDDTVTGDEVLQRAMGRGISPLIVIGRLPDGSMFFSTNMDHPPDVVWALETAKRMILENGFGDE